MLSSQVSSSVQLVVQVVGIGLLHFFKGAGAESARELGDETQRHAYCLLHLVRSP